MPARARHVIPSDVGAALDAANVRDDYEARPAYQRNDYVGWINQAKGAETRSHRVSQMVDELTRGGVYMNMPHRPSQKSTP